MKKRYVAFGLGLLLCAIGLAGWIYQIIRGFAVTNLSNLFSWGLYMGTFEFFIGVSSGGMMLFAIAYLFRVEALKPFLKLSAVTSLVCVVASGVAILTDLGQPFRVLQMLLTPNLGSPLFWDVVVLALYFILCLIAVLIQFLPDIGRNRDRRGAKLDREERSRKLSYVALPLVVIMNAVTTLMFAVQNTREWWHSALLPADSVAVATALGMSVMMLVCLLAVGKSSFKIHAAAFNLMAKIAGVAILIHLGFTALELVTLSWSGTMESKELLELIFGHYGLLYTAELALPLIAMFAYFTRLSRKAPVGLGVMNLLVIIGSFIHRMMLLLPAFNTIPLTISVAGLEENLWAYPIASGILEPGHDLFVTFWDYAPSLVEWIVNLLPFGMVILVLAGAMIFHPMLPEKTCCSCAQSNCKED